MESVGVRCKQFSNQHLRLQDVPFGPEAIVNFLFPAAPAGLTIIPGASITG